MGWLWKCEIHIALLGFRRAGNWRGRVIYPDYTRVRKPTDHKTMSIQFIMKTAVALGLMATSSQAITIFGLGAGGQLYSFDTANPSVVTAVGGASTGLVAIDVRRSNGELYGLTADGSTSVVNRSTGALSSTFSPLTPFAGSVSGFDFNPAVDRMRIVVDGTTNYRMVPNGITGFTAGTVTTDGFFDLDPGVTLLNVAYTNAFSGTGTTLYSIGSNGTLYSHPAEGAPQFNLLDPEGNLGITLSGQVGFDIGPDGVGYLVDGSSLYTVNLGTGQATFSGTLGQSLTSIAAIPEPSAMLLGCTAALGLLRRRRNS